MRLIRPSTPEEAVVALARHAPDARVYAGGIELLDPLAGPPPAVLVDVKRAGIDRASAPDGQSVPGHLRLPATATLTDVLEQATGFDCLRSVAGWIGNVRVRNQATIAGNVCALGRDSTLVPALLLHDATVLVHGRAGMHRRSLCSLLTGAFDTGSEIVGAFDLRPLARSRGWCSGARLWRAGPRGGVVALVALGRDDGGSPQARVAVGGTPVPASRLPGIEAAVATGGANGWPARLLDGIGPAAVDGALAEAGTPPDARGLVAGLLSLAYRDAVARDRVPAEEASRG